eukprot:4949384-Pyramimonas_sp.AAC.1
MGPQLRAARSAKREARRTSRFCAAAPGARRGAREARCAHDFALLKTSGFESGVRRGPNEDLERSLCVNGSGKQERILNLRGVGMESECDFPGVREESESQWS